MRGVEQLMRVAVVGAGPAGIYAAESLANDHGIEVDLFDALPTPFGLVRYGVAPDHFSIRSVRDKLVETLDHPLVRFFGNVTIGQDISVVELHDMYDAVVFTYGASRDRSMGIAGEESGCSIPATEFVKWYTGHPDAQDYTSHLANARDVVVVGLGNVAVDVTRVLMKSDLEMDQTDMPEHVLKALRASAVERVHVVGRRGPQHATFTTKELKELGELVGVSVQVNLNDLPHNDEDASGGNRVVDRNLKVMREWAERDPSASPKSIVFKFYSTPTEYLEQDHQLLIEQMNVTESGEIVSSKVYEGLPADLVIRSVGYRGAPLFGVPFDSERNVIPSVDGKVVGLENSYVAGWIKRGPSGIIGTNKKDAVATISTLTTEISHLPSSARTPDYVVSLLKNRGVAFVDVAGWKRIDIAERALGSSLGKERTTIHERQDLLNIAHLN